MSRIFIGPFPVSNVVNPVSVRLKLPRSLKVHPTFHVSKVKPLTESTLVAASKPPPPPWIVDGGPTYTVKRLSVREDERDSSWWFGRVMAQRRGLGSHLVSWWIGP